MFNFLQRTLNKTAKCGRAIVKCHFDTELFPVDETLFSKIRYEKECGRVKNIHKVEIQCSNFFTDDLE